MEIIKKYINYNFSKRTEGIKYIVIHDTGNKNKGADSMAHFKYFNSGNKNSSAHFFVDDNKIIEVIDPKINKSWHCGDGNGKFGITNNNSIGIEMCVNSDGDFIKTYNNTIELVKHLQKIYNIPNNRVVKHQDASGKICPYSLIKEHKNGKNWATFMNDLSNNNNNNILYRVCVGSYADINNARKKAKEVGGFIVEYKKEQ